MAGGYSTERQRQRQQSLEQRVHPPSGPHGEEPRACWIDADHDPGHVVAWRTAEGRWTALVLVWLPGERVQPRD